MKRFTCFAIALVFVQISSSEAGLIKKVITSITGGIHPSENNQKAPSEINENGNNFLSTSSTPNSGYSDKGNSYGGASSYEGKLTENQGYNSNGNAALQNGPFRPITGLFSQRPQTQGIGNNHNGNLDQHQTHNKSSWTSVNNGSPNGDTHSNRPLTHGGLNSNSSQSQGYKNTTWYIENEDYLTPNVPSYDKQNSNRDQIGKNAEGQTGVETFSQTYRPRVSEHVIEKPEKQNQHLGEAVRQGATTKPDDGDYVLLQSDSIFCHYSNIKDEKIEHRKLTCNDTTCVMEKNSEKSSLWICNDIKCNIANVNFTQNLENKKLIECSMDGRNIITAPTRAVKCGPNEKELKGRCREIFGAR